MIARVLVASFLVLFVAGCGGGGEGEDRSAGPRIGDPGPVHVHGLGVNPKDGALFIATHTGLFRAAKGEQKAKRVADRYQDTMGFTVAGPDRFLGSGHPDFRKDPDLPPLLGLIESTDAGQTWRPISLVGEADFHVLEGIGRRVYGFDSSNQRFMVSADGGRRWSARPPPEPLISLAFDPNDSRRIIGVGESHLYASSNQGGRWRSLGGEPGLLAWPSKESLYLVRGDGRVLTSRDSGKSWTDVGEVGGQPAAFEAEGSRDLYVALHDGTVKRSVDGGQSWAVRSKP